MIKEYIKQPVKIRAVQLQPTFDSIKECYEFMKWYTHTQHTMGHERWYEHLDSVRVSGGITIHTLEGDHLASWGDYIIEGVECEFYPCKPNIFEKTYGEVVYVKK